MGKDYDRKLARLMSTDLQITPDTPPTFLMHSSEDQGVLPENSIAFYTGLRRANVDAELHIYNKGRHGFGLGKGVGTAEQWPDACKRWMLRVTGDNGSKR